MSTSQLAQVTQIGLKSTYIHTSFQAAELT